MPASVVDVNVIVLLVLLLLLLLLKQTHLLLKLIEIFRDIFMVHLMTNGLLPARIDLIIVLSASLLIILPLPSRIQQPILNPLLLIHLPIPIAILLTPKTLISHIPRLK